jgi:hypothetical protein
MAHISEILIMRIGLPVILKLSRGMLIRIGIIAYEVRAIIWVRVSGHFCHGNKSCHYRRSRSMAYRMQIQHEDGWSEMAIYDEDSELVALLHHSEDHWSFDAYQSGAVIQQFVQSGGATYRKLPIATVDEGFFNVCSPAQESDQ